MNNKEITQNGSGSGAPQHLML